jgi:hypothetical protein
VYSTVPQAAVTVSMALVNQGSTACVLGLNKSAYVSTNPNYLNYDYALFCHKDSGQYQVVLANQVVVTPGLTPQTGDVVALVYNGASVRFTVNGVTVYMAALPIANIGLYVAWSCYYTNATMTINATPPVPALYSGNQWVQVETDANGNDDLVWFVTLCQVLLLNLNESPFYATFGIPQQQAVQQGVAPDHYVALTQQYFAPYFSSLIIVKTSDSPPTYEVVAVTKSGVSLTNIVGAVPI